MVTNKKKTFKKLLPWLIGTLSVIVVAVIVVVAVFTGTTADYSAPAYVSAEVVKGAVLKGAEEDYLLVSESDSYELYYYEPTLSIKLVNKQTGAVMESTLSEEKDDGTSNKTWKGYMKSGVVVHAIRGTVNTNQLDLVNSKHTIRTWETPGGIYAEVTFTDFGIRFGVEVKLDGDELVVRVPESSISETKENCYIATITLFPFMGYTYLGEENGYMLVPDGNGALIYLEDKDGRYTTGFSQLIYGADAGFASSAASSYLWGKFEMVTDANQVLAPIFGMAHTDDHLAYLAVVEEGDQRCYIECQPNGVYVNYNRCYARFLLRDVYVQPLNNSNSGTVKTVESDRLHSDLQVRYCLLSGEDANYSGMANAYRDYLLEKGKISRQDCSYNTRIDFLGLEQEEFLMGTTDVVMTTVDNIEEIYAILRKNGVESVLSVYKGWQKGGLYDLPISQYKADGALGSTKALNKLIQEQAAQGYQLYLYNDALLVNESTNTTTFNVMKMVNNRTFKLEVNGQVYDLFYYLMPSKLDSNLQKLANDAAKDGMQNLALAGVTNSLFSYSYRGSFYSRRDTLVSFENTMAAIDEKMSLILETPNAYMWQYADAFLDMPLGSSDFLYLDQDIPFLSLVLKGVMPMYSDYVNFEANKTENFLQMVESGVYPSFYLAYENSSMLIYTNSSGLYSLEYETYMDTIVEYDTALRQLAEQTTDATIVRHETLVSGLVKVSYSNGVCVYVNYNAYAVDADGITIEALSYKVGESA